MNALNQHVFKNSKMFMEYQIRYLRLKNIFQKRELSNLFRDILGIAQLICIEFMPLSRP